MRDMAIVDIKQEGDYLLVESKVVVSSKSDFQTAVQMVVVNMLREGIQPEDAERILEPLTQTAKGF
jgi:hypothetical protein